MNINIISVGKIKEDYFKAALAMKNGSAAFAGSLVLYCLTKRFRRIRPRANVKRFCELRVSRL